MTDPEASTNRDGGPTVSVVVATRNRANRLQRLLHALASQTIGPNVFQVVVVDDCSTDETPEVLATIGESLPYRITTLRTPINRGPGPARNHGWRSTATNIIAFTDDDCVPDPTWLEAGVKALLADQEIGLVQGKTVAADDSAFTNERWVHRILIDGPNPYFETCNIFYRRAALADSGGFGEHLHWWRGWWCEDSYAGWGALEVGWTRTFSEAALVTHDVEIRPLKWWLKASLSQCDEITLATRFPEYRQQTFWRSWAPRNYDAAFVLGTVGLLAALKWKPAALAAAPYVAVRRPGVRQGKFLRACAETVAIDVARTSGNLYGAVRNRTFVV